MSAYPLDIHGQSTEIMSRTQENGTVDMTFDRLPPYFTHNVEA